MDYYRQPLKKILNYLNTNIDEGLNDIDVQERLNKFGYNKLKSKENVSAFTIFIKQFNSVIVYILLFAVLISFLLGEIIDVIVILSILILNAILGFIQEYRAEKAIDELKKISSFKTIVLRNSVKKEINIEELVPGDIIFIEEGDRIPADCRIIESNNLIINESSLTGESVPSSKQNLTYNKEVPLADRKNIVYSSTLVTSGRGKAIVLKTGMDTEIGTIAKLISQKPKQTPLEIKLDRLGKLLAYSVIAICVIIFFVGIIKTGSINFLLSGDLINFIKNSEIWLLTAVSLAVAAVPEGLPTIVTISLSIGVKKLLKKNSLIRNLPSVETLGETNVICTDKTGTLTKNEMTVRNIYYNLKEFEITGTGYSKKGYIFEKDTKNKINLDSLLFRIGVLCNNADIDYNLKNIEDNKKHKENKQDQKNKPKIIGDPTEVSLLISSYKNSLDFSDIRKQYKRVEEIPFNSIRKLMTTVDKDLNKNKEYIHTKGAPEKVLNICDKILVNGKIKKLTPKIKKEILNKNKYFASKALRVLAFSYKEKTKKLTKKDYEKKQIFVGMQAMIDPPRLEVKDSIQKCKKAGIKVIMITGDNNYTAKSIAKEIGIEGIAIEGSKFFNYSKKKQIELIKKIGVLSRVEPVHKLKIVELLQKNGSVVCMTGDGVNDAPAVKNADLGVSMGITGTDVTKSASDMVLLDDSFNTIVSAIEEGRGIYENIKKFVNFLLSSNIAEIFIIFFAIVFGWSLPMTAIMLLWLNLVTDGLPALALGFDDNPKDLMHKKPKSKKENIITKKLWADIILISILITAGVLYLFNTNLYLGIDYARTVAFSALVFMELIRPFNIRKSLGLELLSNIYLIGAVILSFILHFIVVYTPLNELFGFVAINFISWIYIIVISAFVYITYSYLKKLFNYLLDNNNLNYNSIQKNISKKSTNS
jgi:Ca2+-transporting ATPase